MLSGSSYQRGNHSLYAQRTSGVVTAISPSRWFPPDFMAGLFAKEVVGLFPHQQAAGERPLWAPPPHWEALGHETPPRPRGPGCCVEVTGPPAGNHTG